jgi:hypothetical protein
MPPLDRYVNKNQSALFAGKQPYFGHDVESKLVQAPTGGWDAISPLSNMEPKFAVVLDNIVPRPGWVEIRGGYVDWVNGLVEPIETLMTYRSPGAPQEMFAAAGSNIFNVSDQGSNIITLDSTTVVMLHLNGIEGSTTITDEAGHVWTANGSAQITTSTFAFGGGSLFLVSAGSSFISTPDSDDYDFGTGDFTVQLYIRRNGSQGASNGIISARISASNGWALGFGQTGVFGTDNAPFFSDNGTPSFTLTSSTILTDAEFDHVAVVRSSTTITLYQDGVTTAVTSISAGQAINSGNGGLVVGRLYTNQSSNYITAYGDEVKIDKGVALFTEAFSPPIGPDVSGLNSARFQHVNFTPANGDTYLYIVNGADEPLLYDGSDWTNPAFTGSAIPSSFIHINVHKRRVWFVEEDSTKAWYLDTDAIQGEPNPFDLGAFFTRGGFLMAMATWTVDGGNGPDDLAVFISSEGQLIIYKGTDPANPNAWALVGVFNQPKPIGRRCFSQLGSDLNLITLEGVLPISKSLPFDPSGVRSVALTNRIQNAMLSAAQMGQSVFGWQLLPFPQQSLYVLNVPVQEFNTSYQFVMNNLTGAWCRFTGWDAVCTETFNDSFYFGDGDGNVNLGYAGSSDNGAAINAAVKCAFNYFDDPGRNKYMNMLRPLLVTDGRVSPAIGVDVDFGNTTLSNVVTTPEIVGAVWDISLWDVGVWALGSITVTDWISVGAIGVALAIKMEIALVGNDPDFSVTTSGLGVPLFQINGFETTMEFGGAI